MEEEDKSLSLLPKPRICDDMKDRYLYDVQDK
jgi:hypothetical protein